MCVPPWCFYRRHIDPKHTTHSWWCMDAHIPSPVQLSMSSPLSGVWRGSWTIVPHMQCVCHHGVSILGTLIQSIPHTHGGLWMPMYPHRCNFRCLPPFPGFGGGVGPSFDTCNACATMVFLP